MTAPDAAQACPSVEVTPGPVGEPFGASGAQVDPTTCAVLTWSWALEYAGGLIRGRSAELVLRRDGEATTWAALTIDERAWVRSAVGATRSGVADAFARGFLRGEPLPAGPFAAPTRIAPTIIDDVLFFGASTRPLGGAPAHTGITTSALFSAATARYPPMQVPVLR